MTFDCGFRRSAGTLPTWRKWTEWCALVFLLLSFFIQLVDSALACAGVRFSTQRPLSLKSETSSVAFSSALRSTNHRRASWLNKAQHDSKFFCVEMFPDLWANVCRYGQPSRDPRFVVVSQKNTARPDWINGAQHQGHAHSERVPARMSVFALDRVGLSEVRKGPR